MTGGLRALTKIFILFLGQKLLCVNGPRSFHRSPFVPFQKMTFIGILIFGIAFVQADPLFQIATQGEQQQNEYCNDDSFFITCNEVMEKHNVKKWCERLIALDANNIQRA